MKFLSALLFVLFHFHSLCLLGQEPCLPDCCLDGAQHTFEGQTGALPPSQSFIGWSLVQGTPSYIDEGCDSPLTGIELKGGSPADAAGYSPGGINPELFLEGRTYCIKICVKNTGDELGNLTLFGGDQTIGSTPMTTISDGWQTSKFTWTPSNTYFDFTVQNNSANNALAILFDDVCIMEVNPDDTPICQADFSFEIGDCGQVCLTDESCGEITFASWNFRGPGFPASGQGSTDIDPCPFFTPSGTYIVDRIVTCSDGSQSTESKNIMITIPDPPTINCPNDTILVSSDPDPCSINYTFPTIPTRGGTSLTCTINGVSVTAGDVLPLSSGVTYTVFCVVGNDCFSTPCEYTITVQCDVPIECNGPCFDFNDTGSTTNWQRGNHQGNNPTQFTPVNLATRSPGDTFLDGIDISGSTRLINEVDYVGDWTAYQEECCFCFDFKYVDDANTPTTARPQLTIYQGTERNPTLSARYISNYVLTDADPWQKVCAPMTPCTSGQLPSNTDGYWIMLNGSGCTDWNALLSNIDGISFPLDYNGNPRERHGYDNTCWEACPPNPCDSFMVMVDTLDNQITCIDPSIITGNPCIAVYDPVCGCDGNTYGNACEAREQGIVIMTSGECDGSNTPEADGCCYALDIVLKSVSVSAIGIRRLNAGVTFNTVMINDPAFTFTVDPLSTEIIISPVSGSTFGPGVFNDLIKFCLTIDSTIAPPTQFIEVSYYDQNGDELDVLCRKSVEVGCDPPPGSDPCALTTAEDAICQDGYYDLDITVANLSTTPPFTASNVVFTSCDSTIQFRPDGTSLPGSGSIGLPFTPPMGPADPPQTLPVDILPLNPISSPTLFCFETTIWNNNMCCTAPDKTCITLLPCCNPCDSSYYTEVPFETNDTSIVSIKPGASMDDAYLSTCQVGGFWSNTTSLVAGAAWGGVSDGCYSEAFLDFPLNDICPDATILQAEIKLFADPLSFGHVNTTALTTSCLDIKRVTSSWSESSTSLTAPTTTATNQVGLPLPAVPFQDFAVDVTALVQDMLANPTTSFGFALDASCPLDLQYIFASGEHSNPALWPELVVTYDISSCPPVDTACCHTLDIDVACADDFFTKLDLELITPGVIIAAHSTGTTSPLNWSNPITTSQRVIWEHVSGTIPNGNYDKLINFCLGDIDPGESPQELTLKWITQDINGMDSVACIDTLRYNCEPPINDSCLAIIDIIPKNNLCDTCYVEPFCNSWLLDEVTLLSANICPGTATIETGTWMGDPVYIITTGLGFPHTFVEQIYTCQGVLLQDCHDYIAGFSCDPDAGIDVTTDIIGKTIIWSCGDPIPNPPSSCTVLSIPNSMDYCLTIKNVTNPAHLATQLLIQSLDPSVTIWPNPITFSGSGLPSGGVATVDINISGNINPGDTVKMAVRLHDHLTGDNWCCFESDTLCIVIPPCPPEADCCDVTEEEICDILDNIAVPSIDLDECEICWDLSSLDSCDYLSIQIDNQPWTQAYGQFCQIWQDNEVHDVCFRLERWSGGHIGIGEPCIIKETCIEVDVPCDPCDDELSCDDLIVSSSLNSQPGQECCYDITVENNYCEDYFKGIKVSLQSPSSISSVIAHPGFVINQLDNYNAEIYPISGGLLALGQYTPFTICNNSDQAYNLTVTWLHQLPSGTCEEVCETDLELESCGEFSCYEFVQDSIHCLSDTYCFKIKNTSNPGFDLYVAHLYNTTGGLIFSPANVNIPNSPLSSGQTSDWICVNYSGVNPGDQPCFKIAASDQPAGIPPTRCCTDTLTTCITIPDCPNDVCAVCPDGSLPGQNLIQNGDFSAGYAGGWYSTYNLQTSGLTTTNTYSIRNSTSLVNTQWSAIDHTAGLAMDNFLTINGPSSNIAYGVSVAVQPNTDYVFCMWVNNLVHTSTRSQPVIQVWIGGTLVEAGFTLPKLPDTWQLITANYHSGFNASVNIEVVDIDPNQFNDWAIDDVSFRSCGPPPTCCDDFDAFCDLLDLGFQISTNEDCSITVDAPQFDTCHWFGTSSPDWGDGSVNLPVLTPAVGAGPWTHTYAQSGTYNICITVYEGEDEDNFCWDKQMCTEVEIDCCGPIDCDKLDFYLDPDPIYADSCCFIGTIENEYCADTIKGVVVRSNPGSSIAQITALNGWYINQISSTEAELYPASGVGLGEQEILRVCNENFSGIFTLTMAWLIDDGNGECEEICPIEEELDCGTRPPSDSRCLAVISDSTDCKTDLYCFTIQNNTSPSFDIRSVVIHNLTPAGSLSSTVISLTTPLASGATREICVNYQNVVAGDDICFNLTGHDVDINQNPLPTQCCADTLTHCFEVPPCPMDTCCTDFDEFCDLVDLGFDFSVDSSLLTISVDQFDSCHWFGTDQPDWGDGTSTMMGFTNAAGVHSWSHSYDTTGMYTICMDIYEGDSPENICWEKQICKMLWIICDHTDIPDNNPCGPSRLFIPNGFTPNGDGFNDVLVIDGPIDCAPMDIQVYNRWGQLIYEQADYDNTWDGRSSNGELVLDGTYFLVVDFQSVIDQRSSYQQYIHYLDIRTK